MEAAQKSKWKINDGFGGAVFERPWQPTSSLRQARSRASGTFTSAFEAATTLPHRTATKGSGCWTNKVPLAEVKVNSFDALLAR